MLWLRLPPMLLRGLPPLLTRALSRRGGSGGGTGRERAEEGIVGGKPMRLDDGGREWRALGRVELAAAPHAPDDFP